MFFLSSFFLISQAFASEPCHTLAHFEPTSFRTVFPPLPPSGEKEGMDVYALPNVSVSENFALRWGDGFSISQEQAGEILLEFERSWSHEIMEMNFPPPLGSESHLFNIYIGNSGSGAPNSYGAAGYYSSDASGWPMIVLDLNALEESGSYGVIPHEFFHSIQHACDTYSYEGESAWYWEATAIWIENEVYPDDAVYSAFLFGFAFLPHKALTFFDYPDTGELSEYYQYGAFIFPKYLSEFHVDALDVRDSWVQSSFDQTPLSWWEDYFSTEVFLDVVFDFALRNTHWDYAHHDWYTYYLDFYAGRYSQEDFSITAGVHGAGEADWTQVSTDLFPENLGVNYIQLRYPQLTTMELGIVGAAQGDQGSAVSWRVGLVRKTDLGIVYEDLGTGTPQRIENISSDEELTLVVMPIASNAGWGEQFSYEYLFVEYTESVPEPEPEETPKPFFSCATFQMKDGLVWGSMMFMILGLRSRQRLY